MSHSKVLWIAFLSLAAHSAAQSPATLTTILNFDTTPVGLPETGVVIGRDGVLYGTAGWPPGYAVYSLTPPAEPGGTWTYATLYQTTGAQVSTTVTSAPGLAIGEDGVIYGASNRVVNTACDTPCGYIFSLTPPAAPGGVWTETTLYSFTGGADGSGPAAGVTIGPGGALYGPALGGAGKAGTIFSLTPPASPGSAWTETTLYSFGRGKDGRTPSGPLVMDKRGVLYGTTYRGGASNNGVVFSLTPPLSPGGAWTETILHQFTSDGAKPAGLLLATGPGGQPVLYGLAHAAPSDGTIFYSLTPPASPGGRWSEAVLHTFPRSYGLAPGPLVQGSNGVFYGSTFSGGAQLSGSLFALISPQSAGSAWTFRDLYDFPAGFAVPGGNFPYVGEILAVGPNGMIYGTTYGGGPYNFGTVFTLRP